eukprot:TRINITY_DN9714_c0_g1_i1.p1 TRINITY_DN9714_c0_g1~~TRINITY_DN9714_c0_g1_i1.p1  ORF type:complete len:737 (-),score=137.94 TRINITY_DN9714_c0_g1_i1:567-2705(-)
MKARISGKQGDQNDSADEGISESKLGSAAVTDRASAEAGWRGSPEFTGAEDMEFRDVAIPEPLTFKPAHEGGGSMDAQPVEPLTVRNGSPGSESGPPLLNDDTAQGGLIAGDDVAEVQSTAVEFVPSSADLTSLDVSNTPQTLKEMPAVPPLPHVIVASMPDPSLDDVLLSGDAPVASLVEAVNAHGSDRSAAEEDIAQQKQVLAEVAPSEKELLGGRSNPIESAVTSSVIDDAAFPLDPPPESPFVSANAVPLSDVSGKASLINSDAGAPSPGVLAGLHASHPPSDRAAELLVDDIPAGELLAESVSLAKEPSLGASEPDAPAEWASSDPPLQATPLPEALSAMWLADKPADAGGESVPKFTTDTSLGYVSSAAVQDAEEDQGNEKLMSVEEGALPGELLRAGEQLETSRDSSLGAIERSGAEENTDHSRASSGAFAFPATDPRNVDSSRDSSFAIYHTPQSSIGDLDHFVHPGQLAEEYSAEDERQFFGGGGAAEGEPIGGDAAAAYELLGLSPEQFDSTTGKAVQMPDSFVTPRNSSVFDAEGADAPTGTFEGDGPTGPGPATTGYPLTTAQKVLPKFPSQGSYISTPGTTTPVMSPLSGGSSEGPSLGSIITPSPDSIPPLRREDIQKSGGTQPTIASQAQKATKDSRSTVLPQVQKLQPTSPVVVPAAPVVVPAAMSSGANSGSSAGVAASQQQAKGGSKKKKKGKK